MDFRQIEAFIHVAKLNSFSKAADVLFLTQPTISAHISSLENELGVKLLDRSGKEIVPTYAGKIFLDYAISLTNIRDSAIHNLSEFINKLEGRIEIAASTVPAQYIIPQLIKSFLTTGSKINFSVMQMDSEQVIEAVLDKSIEIGIAGTKSENPKLEFIPIKNDRLVLITPNSGRYSSICSSTLTFDDIKNEHFIIRESGSGTRKELERIFKKNSLMLKSLNIIAQMNSTEAIKQAVSSGLGISIVSLLSVEDYLSFKLIKAFEIEGLDMQRPFFAVYQKNRPMSPLSMAFLNHILKSFDKL
ncbi:MAG: selenium metabolism-associated LysR family transcriptional regulator [Bacillota bacterium]